MLTPPRSAHLVVRKNLNSSMPVETQTDLIWSDLKNPTSHFNGRTSTSRLFKILKFSELSLPGKTFPTHTIHSNGLSGLISRLWVPGDLGSIPGRVIPKTLKMELDTTLLNTQHYKVRFKGKVEQSREWSSALPYTLV